MNCHVQNYCLLALCLLYLPASTLAQTTAQATLTFGPVTGTLSAAQQDVVELACDNRLTALLATTLTCEYKSEELVMIKNTVTEMDETFAKATMEVVSTAGAANLNTPFVLGQAIETILNGSPDAFIMELMNVAGAEAAFFATVTTLSSVVSLATTAAPSVAPTPAPTSGPKPFQLSGELPILFLLGTAVGVAGLAVAASLL